MPSMSDNDRRIMSDDERATVGQKYRRKPDSEPPPNKKPSALEAFLARIPVTWKALTLISAIFLAGVGGHSYIINYTKKYVTHDELAAHSQLEADMWEQIRILRETDAARSADIAAIKSDTAAVREDIRSLLQYMLQNPPPRASTTTATGKGKRP